jgi:hypothetical protein
MNWYIIFFLYKIIQNKYFIIYVSCTIRGRHGLDCMVVGLTTTSAICAYHHVSSNPAHGEVCYIQHYVIKFVSDLQQVGGLRRGTKLYSTNKTEILLKVVFNTIPLILTLVLFILLTIFWTSIALLIINDLFILPIHIHVVVQSN